MAEVLPISLPEVYRRVNKITDPVKRAGAQAFAGVYAPVLSMGLKDSMPSMRSFALRAKEFALAEASVEFSSGLISLHEMDKSAEQTGQTGTELLGLTVRVANSLKRAGITELAALKRMSEWELLGVRNLGRGGLGEINQKLAILEGKIPQEPEQAPPSGLRLSEAAEALKKPGSKVENWVTMKTLNSVIVKPLMPDTLREWIEAVKKLDPAQKGAARATLVVAELYNGINQVGDIRRMSDDELIEAVGANRATFLRKVFEVAESAPYIETE